jgi:hypothetical protein
LLVVLSVASVVVAYPSSAKNCRAVHATIVDASAPEGCTSVFNFCAAGTVEGNRGLNGTTYFVLDGVTAPPTTAPGFSVTSGVLVYTTNVGTLTVRETGVSKVTGHPSNGVLTSIQEIISGTGKFSGATGTLYNNATDINSTFHSTIRGTLCLAHGDGDSGQDAARDDVEGEDVDSE